MLQLLNVKGLIVVWKKHCQAWCRPLCQPALQNTVTPERSVCRLEALPGLALQPRRAKVLMFLTLTIWRRWWYSSMRGECWRGACSTPRNHRNGSKDTWPRATATGLTRRDRRLQQGVCHQGRKGDGMKGTSRTKTRQGLVRVVYLKSDFNVFKLVIIIPVWRKKKPTQNTFLVILCKDWKSLLDVGPDLTVLSVKT